ncbi:MAG TPA: response regulator [Verrucomicrobiae bacterium]|nr:response regulator [Verrucomicrobiae bacterium]
MEEKKKILIIDDDAAIVQLLAMHLQAKGYEVVTAKDGADALAKLRKVTPDLISLDMEMPKVGGLEFYRRISDGRSRTRIPVLVVTGRGELSEVFKDLEVDGFLSKPFELHDYLCEVERILFHGSQKGLVYILDIPGRHSEQIARRLKTERYKVISTVDLAELSNRFAQEPPDFILMEYEQADVEGSQRIRETQRILAGLQKGSGRKAVPLIVYTYSGFDFAEKSLSAGADRYAGTSPSYDSFVTLLREYELEK